MSPRTIALLAFGGVALVAVGYLSGRRENDGKTAPASPSAQPVAPAPAPSIVPSAAPLPSATASAPGNPMTDPGALGDLFGRLEGERKSRKKVEPTAETVFDAAKKKAGVEVDEELQVAGWVVGALYCDKIRSKKDVHIVVCEYADEAKAIEGQKSASNEIKRREVLRNKTTTCAVHQAGEGKAAEAEAAKVKELFKAM